MKILVVAATKQEIEQCSVVLKNNNIDVLITGVGMVATAFSMGKKLSLDNYDLAINAGIAGSFDRNLKIGEVVEITEDLFAELGAEDGDSFLSIDELGFGQQTMKPNLPAAQQDNNFGTFRFPNLKKVRSITVNRIHGNEMSIANTLEHFHPQVESMEGAAFFYACNQASIPSIQIRAISNYVERRNRETWNISLAVKNLNDTLISIFEANNPVRLHNRIK